MRIALVGCGVMGGALLGSLLAADGVAPEGVTVTDARAETAEALAAEHAVRAASTNAEAVANADVVLLAVKPQYLAPVLADVAPALAPGALVVSVAAGVPLASYASQLPAGTPVVRVMPNTPATIGQGVSALSGGEHTDPEHLALVERLLAGTGLVVRVPEEQLAVITGLSGSGPAYVFHVIEALAEAGTALGLPRELALRLASHTVAGSGAYAVASGTHPSLLREAVSSPGGTTLAGLAELDERAVRAAFAAAVRAATNRAEELGRA